MKAWWRKALVLVLASAVAAAAFLWRRGGPVIEAVTVVEAAFVYFVESARKPSIIDKYIHRAPFIGKRIKRSEHTAAVADIAADGEHLCLIAVV